MDVLLKNKPFTYLPYSLTGKYTFYQSVTTTLDKKATLFLQHQKQMH